MPRIRVGHSSVSFASIVVAVLLWPRAVLAQPVLEYRFNEGAGSTTLNSGSYGTAANGSLLGVAFSSDTPAGSGSSVIFNGSSGLVQVADAFDYTQNGGFVPSSSRLTALTVEAWIKPHSQSLSGQHVVWDDFGNPGVLFAVTNGGVQFSISTVGAPESHPGPGQSVFSPNGALIAGTWQHIAGVYDGRKMRIFIEGQDACVVARTRGGIQNNTEVNGALPSAIGRDNVNDLLRFAGLIDDLRIHPRALDRTELANGAFAGDDPIPCPPVVPSISAWGFPLAALLMLLAGSGALLATPPAPSRRES